MVNQRKVTRADKVQAASDLRLLRAQYQGQFPGELPEVQAEALIRQRARDVAASRKR